MELSIFTPEKKKTNVSIGYTPSKAKATKLKEPLQGKKIQLNKPNFLYFTQRERQNINFFECTPSILNDHQNSFQKEIDSRINCSFIKNFKLKSKHFDSKENSLHQDQSYHTSKQKFIRLKSKYRPTLRRKAYKYKNEQPCVGMYNAKPENFMKRIAKNQVFRKGKSCHNIPSKIQNNQNLIGNKFNSSHSKPDKNQKQRVSCQSKSKAKASLPRLISKQKKCEADKIYDTFSVSKMKIKCFDMSKQSAREPFKSISNKMESIDCDNDYIEKNYKRKIFISTPMSEHELSTFYDRQKRKYRIESSCGILKNIKLEDFIKIHRSEVLAQDQNFY